MKQVMNIVFGALVLLGVSDFARADCNNETFTCYASVWGYSGANGSVAPTLQKITLGTVSVGYCADSSDWDKCFLCHQYEPINDCINKWNTAYGPQAGVIISPASNQKGFVMQNNGTDIWASGGKNSNCTETFNLQLSPNPQVGDYDNGNQYYSTNGCGNDIK